MEKNNIEHPTAAPAYTASHTTIESVKTPVKINKAAAFGASLLSMLIIVGVGIISTILAGIIEKIGTSSGSMGFTLLVYGIVSLVLFAALPLLITLKHGWRTLVMTYILEGLFLLVASFIIVFVVSVISATGSTNYDYGDPDCINCGINLQKFNN